MAASTLSSAPVLSTPDTHIFEDPTPPVAVESLPKLSDEQLYLSYEIERTVKEIREGKWRRVALQFPDEMLVDAPRVYQTLNRKLKEERGRDTSTAISTDTVSDGVNGTAQDLQDLKIKDDIEDEERLSILGDTSYGACCVDEVAAEHVDADVVVHYGRSCLSPTSRLPVIYVFTTRPLDTAAVEAAFKETYPNTNQKIILMADIPYSSHLPELSQRLQQTGYTNIFITSIVHNPSAALPNRTVPPKVEQDIASLQDYQLFHISQPPTALLLTLSSRLGAIHIYPTTSTQSSTPAKALQASTAQSLRRRYAIITSLSTASIWGILINTLSVANYQHMASHVRALISAQGKKSYTFVVGKVNPAKIANFAEIEGWVVVGCWESSLVESREFFRPVVTPFELEIALVGDGERVWTGEWRSDFQTLLERGSTGVDGERQEERGGAVQEAKESSNVQESTTATGDYDSDEESAPPEFDLRTGRYVSHTRPMRMANTNAAIAEPQSPANSSSVQNASTSLIRRANGELAQVGGVVSPGAEYLRSQRTWQGLGSDFETDFTTGSGREGAAVEEGRSGVARGYTVGDDQART